MAGTTKQHQSHPYTVNRITDRHITRHGVIQVPKAGADGTEPSLIKVHAEYQYRVVDFVIQEMGDEPLAPKAEAQEGEVLKYSNVILESAQINMGAPGSGLSLPSDGSGFSGGGANAAGAAAALTTEDKPDLVKLGHIYTKRGRYIFVRKTPITQDSGKLKYPQAPSDSEKPQKSLPDSWVSTLLGSDTEGGNNSSGSVDGAGVPPASGE